MTRSKYSRLLTPAVALLAGSGIACAVGIRQNWSAAIASEAIALCWATALYFWGRSDTDTGAVLSQQEDERQQLVGLKATQLALAAVIFAIVVVCLIAAASKYEIWPYQVLLVIIGIAYFVGMRAYGFDGDESGNGAAHSRLGFPKDQVPD